MIKYIKYTLNKQKMMKNVSIKSVAHKMPIAASDDHMSHFTIGFELIKHSLLKYYIIRH